MSKIKAKLTALLMAACCCLACIGIGVSFNKANNVVANAATTEELTAEFTNNGQFTVGQFKEGMSHEFLDSTAEGVPEGASGAVLKITGVGDDGSATGGAFATLDFTAAGCFVTGTDVVVRVYQPSNLNFRTSRKAGSAEWKTQKTLAAGWTEVTLSAATNAAEDHQIMTTMSMGFRRGAECYIDSVTVVDNDLKKDFTNDGQFDVKQYSTHRTYFVDGSAEGLPEGYEGAVLKLYPGATQYVNLDFSGSGLKASDVASMSAKCYLPNAYADGTYTDSKYEFRLGNIENSAGGAGAYDMSTWFVAPINVAKIATDADGFLTTVTIGLRNKGDTKETTGSYFYIDGITISTVDYEVVQVGAVELYGAGTNATRVDRLYLKPTDQTVTWYDANANFDYVGGTGLQVLRNGKVVQTLKPALVNRNSNVGKASNIKHLYLSIGSLTLQAGDVVKYGGIFQNATAGMRYVVEDSEVLWDGTYWGKNAEYSEPSAITKLKPVTPSTTANGASNKAVYLKMKSGDVLPFRAWENIWLYESGTGLKVNGESVTMKSMQSAPEGIYLTFDELTAGDEVTFGGTFRCPTQKIKYTIEDSKFVWNGTVWEPEYTTYNVGDVKFKQIGAEGKHIYFSPVSTANFDTTTWNSGWDAQFSWKDGVGVTINGETVSNAKVKFPGSFFIEFATAPQVGDILRVGGTYYNVSVAKEYKINEAEFRYNGTAWEKVINYSTYTVTKLGMAGGSNASTLYLYSLAGDELPKDKGDWNSVYAYGEGASVKLNDEAISSEVKLPGDLYVPLGKDAAEGDVFTINGTFYNSNKAVKLVFDNCKLQWNGTAWVEYVEYTTYNVSKMTANKAGCSATAIQATLTADKPLPENVAGDWDNVYTFETGSGTGLTLGENALTTTDIKYPGSFYVGFGATAKEGDVLTVDGTFYNKATAFKFVFDNCKLQWNGTAWVEYVEYTTYELNGLTLYGNSATTDKANAGKLQLIASGFAHPAEAIDFTLESGVGLAVNDTQITGTIKNSSGKYLYLTFTALNKGDKLTIGGTFVNKEKAVKYVLEETNFWWDGTTWATEEPSVEIVECNLGELLVASPSAGTSAKATQLYIKSTVTLPFTTWQDFFKLESGSGWKLNGTAFTPNEFISADGNLFANLASAGVQKGDVLSVSGTFVHTTALAKYVIEESSFMWNGSFWVDYVTDDRLEVYDVISLYDMGLGISLSLEGTVANLVSKSFMPSDANTTNSVAIRFGYNCADTALAGANLRFRLRGAEWQGITFDFRDGKVYIQHLANTKSYALKNNTDYVIEIAAISMKDGRVWAYVKVDDTMVLSAMMTEAQFATKEYFADYATKGFTNHISVYGQAIAATKLTSLSSIAVNFVTENGTYTEVAKANESYTLPTGKSNKTFIGWAMGGKLYAPGAEINVTEELTFTAVAIDFTMEKGAAIRLAQSADQSGIRFTSWIKEAELTELLGKYGIKNISYGTLIMPYDYLGLYEEPNLVDFSEKEEEILKIPSTKNEQQGGYVIFRGAMQKLYEENYNRLFAGRGYMEITFESGEVWTVYTPFDKEDNVRSVRYIARAMQTNANGGDDEYAGLDDKTKAVVDTYALADEIVLMNYAVYENNATPVIAWNYPKLDPTNDYMNDTNYAIANTMKDAGVQMVGLTGANLKLVNTVNGIETTRKIIRFFYSQGLYTFAFAGNGSKHLNCDLATDGFPDFSDCEGFIGYLAWDEPANTAEAMEKLAAFARAFELKYAGTDVTFMVNLIPSYASYFGKTWDALNKDSFKTYLDDYCKTVLSQVSGEKWLSLDSYPINKDASLTTNFLFDLAMLKYYAEEHDAHSHIVLQSSGWKEGGNDAKSRIPTEAELRMQAYTAMAFGIDSMSWFTYSPSAVNSSNEYITFVDNEGNIVDQTAYDAFKKVSAEMTAISSVYGAFDWKGVILGIGKDNTTSIFGATLTTDYDYEAYNAVSGQIGDYELSASDTKYLASVKSDKTDWNYLLGVMEDMYGNEGYVLSNYNNHKDTSHKDMGAQKITLTFDDNVTEVVIYRGGVAQTVSVTNKTLSVELAMGEGVIILPSKIEK